MRQNVAEDVLKTVLQSVTESKTDGLEQRGEVQEQEVFQALEQMDQSGKTAQTRSCQKKPEIRSRHGFWQRLRR